MDNKYNKRKRLLKNLNITRSDIITVAIVIAIFATSLFFIKPVVVRGVSMEPTLKDGDYQIVNAIKDPNNIKRGEIVVLRWNETLLIKRVVGIAGDIVDIDKNTVKINKKPLDEKDYIKEPAKYETGKWLIPKDSVFVMGDNRNESFDSRSFGPVKKKDIIGTVIRIGE